MPIMSNIDHPPPELVLGTRLNSRVPEADQKRQRAEVEEILRRLCGQPGVILADEVGMGKTFIALAVAYCYAVLSRRGPVIVMVPANLVDKWTQDLHTFCDLYLENRRAVDRDRATRKELMDPAAVRYGVARHSVDLMKLLDDAPRERCHLIFLAQGAMSRRQTDKWVRLALIAEDAAPPRARQGQPAHSSETPNTPVSGGITGGVGRRASPRGGTRALGATASDRPGRLERHLQRSGAERPEQAGG
jgi:hypothetical protein